MIKDLFWKIANKWPPQNKKTPSWHHTLLSNQNLTHNLSSKLSCEPWTWLWCVRRERTKVLVWLEQSNIWSIYMYLICITNKLHFSQLSTFCFDRNCDKPRLIEALKTKRIRDIACGSSHSAAVTSSGELYTWGLGEYGRLGHGDNTTQLRPKLVSCLELGRLCQDFRKCCISICHQTVFKSMENKQTQP